MRPRNSVATSCCGIARPMPALRTVLTATPTSLPSGATTGPPLLPGLSAPFSCTFDTCPDLSVRILDTVAVPMLISGFLSPDASRAPNGNPHTYTVLVSMSFGGSDKSSGFGKFFIFSTLSTARSGCSSAATTRAGAVRSVGVPLLKTTRIGTAAAFSPIRSETSMT